MCIGNDLEKLLPPGYILKNADIQVKGKLTYFKVICDKGHLWVNCQVTKLLSGKRCPFCIKVEESKNRLLPQREFELKLVDMGYSLLTNFEGMTKRVTIRCNTCDHVRVSTASNIHDRCQICTNKSRKDLTDSNILKNLELNNISFISRDSDCYTLRCKKCGKTYEVFRKSLLRKPYCSKCASLKSLTLNEISLRAGINYIVEGVYLNERSILKFTHKTCGKSFDRTWNSFQQGLICPECAKNRCYSNDELINLLASFHLILIEGIYENIDSKLALKCEVSYHKVFRKSIRQLTYSEIYHCPECHPQKRSSQEELIAQYIESLGFTVIRNDTSFGKEIDIYIPERNIGIEYCGHVYHNHTKKLPLDHVNKQEFLKLKGIDVAFIFDDQWRNKENLFKWFKIILNTSFVEYTSYCIVPYNVGLNFFNNNYCDKLSGTTSYLFVGGFVGSALEGLLVFEIDSFEAICIRHINLNREFLDRALALLQENNFTTIRAIARCQFLENIPFEKLGYPSSNSGLDEYIVRSWRRKIYREGDSIPYGWFRLTGCRVKEYHLVN